MLLLLGVYRPNGWQRDVLCLPNYPRQALKPVAVLVDTSKSVGRQLA